VILCAVSFGAIYTRRADHSRKKLTALIIWLKIHYPGDKNLSWRRKTRLFLGFRAQPLINPKLGLLYDVFLCLLFRMKHVAPSDDDIMETKFLSKLNVGGRYPAASIFVSINRG
jgi:hypothetical protein